MDQCSEPVGNEPKNDPGTNKISAEEGTATHATTLNDSVINSNIIKGMAFMMEFMQENERQEFAKFYREKNWNGQHESVNQSCVTQQRSRYYSKQLLLLVRKIQRQFMQQKPIENDGSLINQLNDDCLANIFKYLPVEERLKMEEVCQQWKRALEHAWSDVKKLDYNYYNNRLDRTLIKSKRQEIITTLRRIPKLICHCGLYLNELDITALSFSQIMPVIKLMCLNLIKLQLLFRETIDEDFKDAFDFMPNLKSLEITWDCKIIMSETFIESLNTVTDTLEDLKLINIEVEFEDGEEYYHDFPDSWISTFRCFKSLKSLVFAGYNLNDEIIEAISQKENLIKLDLSGNSYDRDKSYAQNIYSISNLTNLEHLKIALLNVTDNFLINLADNSKNLKYLEINNSNISDAGIIPLTKLKKLEEFLTSVFDGTDDITDESVGKFKNMKKLSFQNSREVTNDAIIKVLENCPNLEELNICHTGVTIEIIEEAARIKKNRKDNVKLKLATHFTDAPDIIYSNE